MRIHQVVQTLGLCALLALLACSPARAALIYDNGATIEDARASDADIPLFLADSFVLQVGANTITDIHWTGVYGTSGTPHTDAFTIQIYDDSGSGVPGLLLQSYTPGSAVNRTDTGVNLLGFDIYAYAVDSRRSSFQRATLSGYRYSTIRRPTPMITGSGPSNSPEARREAKIGWTGLPTSEISISC